MSARLDCVVVELNTLEMCDWRMATLFFSVWDCEDIRRRGELLLLLRVFTL